MMNQFENMIFKIHKIRDRYTGEAHERESRRKGHQLKFIYLEIDKCVFWQYVEDGGVMRTSPVESFNLDEDILHVTTRNTNYEFIRVKMEENTNE